MTAAFLMTVLAGLLALLIGTTPCAAEEPDDSNLFVDAFNAYQGKDYLLAIEKVDRLNQIFPDSPLRDLSLLLLARAGLRSGDYGLAARAINQFNKEYADNSLKTVVEDELLALGARLKKGENPAPNKQLQAAAQKVRNERLAQERAAALKSEQERRAREQAELERIAREKAEAQRRERERIAAEKAAKEAIKLAIDIPGGNRLLEAGKKGVIPFELFNKGTGREEFLLAAAAPKEYAVALTSADRPGELIERVSLAAGEKISGNVALQMPSDKVDGSKALIQLKAVSAKYGDMAFSGDTVVSASAPLVRAVAKPRQAMVARGETVKYRVTVLNAGSVTARGLTVRAIVPPQLELIDTTGADYRREAAGIVSFTLTALETGRLAEFNLNLRVRDDAADKQELRLQLEVVNAPLLLKETFTSSAAVVHGR